MFVYLIKRLLAMVPTLLGITFVTFMIVNCAPGDPVGTGFGSEGGGGPDMDGGGGGGDQDRQGDAIKAKKKLLGMVTEDEAVRSYSLGEGLELEGRLGEDEGWARALAQGPDGLVEGLKDGRLLVLDADGDVALSIQASEQSLRSVVVSPNGALVAAGDNGGGLGVWSLTDGAKVAAIEPIGKPVRALLFLDDERLLAGADDGRIRLFDPSDMSLKASLEEHIAGVYALERSADGERFYSGGYDRGLREWDATELTLLRSSDAHGQAINAIALSPDGATVATACDDRHVRLISLETLEETVRMEGHYARSTAVAWSADGATLFTGSHDETLRAWSVADGSQLAQTEKKVGRVSALVMADSGQVQVGADAWREVPVAIRYLSWLGRIARLDFDRSFVDDRLVIDKIAEALPVTLMLNLIALLIIYLVSIPLGVYAAMKRGSTFDHVSSFVLFLLYSVPNFWLATLLIMGLSSKRTLDWLPSVGLISDNAQDLSYLQWLGDGAMHLVLPVIVLVYAGFASLSRYTRTSLLETIGENYVRTARAKGLTETVVIVKHAFRNSLITIVTLIGNLLPAMIGGSVIVEYIFTIEGMGMLGFDAILTRDYPMIMAVTTFSAFLTLMGILVSDVLYSVVDPRVRLG